MICRRYLLPFWVLTLSLSGFIQACTSTQPGHVAMDTTDISEPSDQLAPDDSLEPDVSVDSWTPSDTVPTSDTVISDDTFEDVSPLEDVSHDVEPDPLSDVATDTTEPGFDVVEDVEPDPSHDLCKNIYEGDYVITKQSDVDVIVDVCAISGNLEISGDASLTTVSLPLLQSIGGKLYVFGTEPAVFNVDPVNTSLTTLALPTLESLGGSIWIHDNSLLTTIDLSALTAVNNLWIETNPMLESLLLPVLSNVSESGFGGELIVSASSLTTILLPELESVGSLHVFDNGVLKELVAPNLALIGSTAYIYRNDVLEAFDLSSLETFGGELDFLTHILFVYDNPSLPQCLLDALIDQLTAQAGLAGQACFQADPPCAQSKIPGGSGDPVIDQCVCVEQGMEECCSVMLPVKLLK